MSGTQRSRKKSRLGRAARRHSSVCLRSQSVEHVSVRRPRIAPLRRSKTRRARRPSACGQPAPPRWSQPLRPMTECATLLKGPWSLQGKRCVCVCGSLIPDMGSGDSILDTCGISKGTAASPEPSHHSLSVSPSLPVRGHVHDHARLQLGHRLLAARSY